MKEFSFDVYERKWHHTQAVLKILNESAIPKSVFIHNKEHLTGYVSNLSSMSSPNDKIGESGISFSFYPHVKSSEMGSVQLNTNQVEFVYFRWATGYYQTLCGNHAFIQRRHDKKSFKIGLCNDAYTIKFIKGTKIHPFYIESALVDPFTPPTEHPKNVMNIGGVLNPHYFVDSSKGLFYHHTLIGNIQDDRIYLDSPVFLEDVMKSFQTNKVFFNEIKTQFS